MDLGFKQVRQSGLYPNEWTVAFVTPDRLHAAVNTSGRYEGVALYYCAGICPEHAPAQLRVAA